MKDSDRAAVAPRQIWSLLRVLGFILAIFAVCFAALWVHLEDNDLRNRIRKIEVQLSKSTDAPNLVINDDHKGEGDLFEDGGGLTTEDNEDDDVKQVPDWIRSIHEVIPILTNKTNATQIDSSLKYVNGLTRVRRRAMRKGRGKKRPCDGCCRVCDCSNGKGKKRRGRQYSPRNCRSCCEVCAGQCSKPDSNTPTGAEHVNSFFRDRLGHFLGSEDINFCEAIGAIDHRRGPNYPKTKTGYICGWQYADWMKRDARDLYILDVKTGIVTVTEKGIYYVYGQLVMHDSRPTASMGIMIEDKNEKVEIARCIETAGYLIGKGGEIADPSGTFRTCHMGSITELDKNAKVYVYVNVPTNSEGKAIPFTIYHSNMTTFFGAIKYA